SASTAWTLPACSCGSPPGGCVNTSHSGHWLSAGASVAPALVVDSSFFMLSAKRRPVRPARRSLAARAWLRTPPPRRAPPRRPRPPGRGCRATRRERHAIARAVALHHAPELIPVDGPDLPVAGGLVVAERRVGDREIDRRRLAHGEVDETLTQLVVALPLHAP